MAEDRHLQVSLGGSKKPRISVETVPEKQNRNMDLQLELLENYNVKVRLCQFDKNEEKKFITNIA